MKTIPPPCPEPENGPKYWRSLDQLAETPEFRQWVEREFPPGASEFTDPVSRRHFVKIMSASFLLAGLGWTGCRRPEEHIVPFGRMPEGYVHGVAKQYATAMPTRGGAIPLVVRSHEGRPIKVEGNAEYPGASGGTDRYAQASILNLYDPDRATRFSNKKATAKRETALQVLAQAAQAAQANGGQGLAVLKSRNNSPSSMRLQSHLARVYPQARWFANEAIDTDIHRRAATEATGQPQDKQVVPIFHFDKAQIILSLDADFLGSEEETYRHIQGFAQGRRLQKPSDPLNRLYVIESLMSITGANADHRLRLQPGAIPQAAAQLASVVLENATPQDKWVAECGKDLLQHKGKCLVVAGHRQPLAVHLLAYAMNQALGAIGTAITFQPALAPTGVQEGGIAELAQALNAGQVSTLVILGGNPSYTAPAEINWPAAQVKAQQTIRLGYYEDETSAASTWVLPEAHYLESWGDAVTTDGRLVPVQPLIEPLFGGLTEIEVLARLAGQPQPAPYEIVRETFRGLVGENNFEENWKKFLHDGFWAEPVAKPVAAQVKANLAVAARGQIQASPAGTKDNLEVVFHRDYSLDDGRYNNNGWLQELPDPITKITWENAILISKATADAFGLVFPKHEDNQTYVPKVKVQLGGREIEGPAWIQPGMADNTLALALGYGRSITGRVGRGAGYNAYRLRSSAGLNFTTGAKLSATGDKVVLALTQDHGSMEGRPIIREANLKQYQEHPDFAKGLNLEEPPVNKSLYPNPLDRAKGTAIHQWGMVIDLNQCVGCSACMIACQSENNVPIVGKRQVAHGREMHWLRLDRYYAGSVADPQVVNQPMLCQHCEAAPCENVCPVNATTHDHEGLNVMIYNRCVGTRYCSNNCPYKIRRFNYFDYNKRPLDRLYESPLTSATDGEWELKRWWNNMDGAPKPYEEWELLKMIKNPDVTVRMRGVMEKCSFCLQRIETAKIDQKVKAGASGDVKVPDGTFTTACAQACPADAIVFGDVSDPNSRVSKTKTSERNYSVLEFLATKPRTTYLAKVRNPNPSMPDYKEMPLTLKEYIDKNGNPFEHHGAHGAKDAGHGAAKAGDASKKGGH